VDRLDPVGVYFGTSTGQLYGSADEGLSWSRIADNLPPIWSVETLVLD
ncbi:MAG: exo-alpha-sialidase, partial [Candidatus Limnocylindrales bacterium]